MNSLDIQNSEKLTENFSGFVTAYTIGGQPYYMGNDAVIMQAGLPHGDRLSDDYDTTLAFNGEQQSNFQFFGIGKPSAKQLARRAKKDITQQITGCVKPKPIGNIVGGVLLGGGLQQTALLNKYKKNLAAYKKCLEEAKNRIQSQAVSSQEKEAMTDEINKKIGSADKEDKSDDKILGIPKTGFYVGLAVVALVGGFLFYKKVIKKD